MLFSAWEREREREWKKWKAIVISNYSAILLRCKTPLKFFFIMNRLVGRIHKLNIIWRKSITGCDTILQAVAFFIPGEFLIVFKFSIFFNFKVFMVSILKVMLDSWSLTAGKGEKYSWVLFHLASTFGLQPVSSTHKYS